MCGIAGVWRPGPLSTRDVLLARRMVRSLAHRGPDEERVVALEGSPGVALGTRRLAIIDLAGGSQPLQDAAGGAWVAMNGEIYNHHALRKELAARGVAFRTTSDTEVAATLFAALDPHVALSRLDGMFGVAAWVPERRRLVLARDRLGEKALYWTRLVDGSVLFGSELKALLAHPDVPREVDPRAVDALLAWEFVPAPRTIYQGVHKLEPGTMVVVEDAGVTVRRWWEPPLPGVDRRPGGVERWAPGLANALQVAVRSRVVADVPVGVLLSGGVDSSTVAALAARFTREPLHTFSVTFREPSFDESGPASVMARHLGSRHAELPFTVDRLPALVDDLERSLCEPLADGSLLAMTVLAEGVRAAGFKAVLSGDGADEHFGGYPTYHAHRAAAALRPLAGSLRRLAAWTPVSTDNLSAGYLARRLVAGLALPLPRRNQVWLGAWLPEELEGLLGRGADPWTEVDRHADRSVDVHDAVDRAMYLDQRLYLADGVVQKVDRASMRHGVEVRAPFLSHELVELAARLPRGVLLRDHSTKRVLKAAVADLLPRELLVRAKKGFGTPLGPWLRGPARWLLDDLAERLEGSCDPAVVRRVTLEHLSGVADHRRRLWSLVVLSRWWGGPHGPGSHPEEP